jgi:hypothetical protein
MSRSRRLVGRAITQITVRSLPLYSSCQEDISSLASARLRNQLAFKQSARGVFRSSDQPKSDPVRSHNESMPAGRALDRLFQGGRESITDSADSYPLPPSGHSRAKRVHGQDANLKRSSVVTVPLPCYRRDGRSPILAGRVF